MYWRSAATGPSYFSIAANDMPVSSASSAAVRPDRMRCWISRGVMVGASASSTGSAARRARLV